MDFTTLIWTVARILKVANDAASISTGINDYMVNEMNPGPVYESSINSNICIQGFEAKEQQKRAKAVADLTLAAGNSKKDLQSNS